MLKTGHVYLDITEPLPFDEATFNYVFLEHTIEHIQYKDALSMLREVYRVRKPGVVLRVTTPNLEVYLQLFTPNRAEAAEHGK